MRFVPVFVLLTLAVPAAAQDAAPKPEKKICRAVQTTGSIMAKRDCRTKAEWEAVAKANEKANRNYNGDGNAFGSAAAVQRN
ncbi:hypothetical protein AB2M62_15275 [Sphingomonas sp. MMS12-HWE2-04]|uniref:hypothetical protein n=1 Tax=Sphingomonas sp. MMS12-HWE2-04 TaxID=3234199 RepID=UPI00384AC87C